MKQTQNIIICDNCELENIYDITSHYGGNPIHGWIDVNIINGSTTLSTLHKKTEFDFCCTTCLLEYFTKNP